MLRSQCGTESQVLAKNPLGLSKLDGLIVFFMVSQCQKMTSSSAANAVVGRSLKKKPIAMSFRKVWVPSNSNTLRQSCWPLLAPKVCSKIAWDHSWHCIWPAEFLDHLSAAAKDVNLCVLGTF